jgi:uncharacterized protein YydD (DUF2326 family)
VDLHRAADAAVQDALREGAEVERAAVVADLRRRAEEERRLEEEAAELQTIAHEVLEEAAQDYDTGRHRPPPKETP